MAKPTVCTPIKIINWVSSAKCFKTRPPYQRPSAMPVPNAATVSVEIAGDALVRSIIRAAAQNEIANSLAIQATKPNQDHQNSRDNFPVCGPDSSGTCTSGLLSRIR